MARKLKTFQTSLGFYNLVIAAPSMKAALEAWGAGSNLFHQGIAAETEEAAVVAATMAKPGIVLKRPAGSNGRFSEKADIPSQSAADDAGKARSQTRQAAAKICDDRSRRKNSNDEIRETTKAGGGTTPPRRRSQRKSVGAAGKAVAKARAALTRAEQEHQAKASSIEVERAVAEARLQAEDERWFKQNTKLSATLRRAQEGYLFGSELRAVLFQLRLSRPRARGRACQAM